MALKNVWCIHQVEGSVDDKMDSQDDHNEVGKCPAEIQMRAKENVWCVVMTECKSVAMVWSQGSNGEMVGWYEASITEISSKCEILLSKVENVCIEGWEEVWRREKIEARAVEEK